MVVHACLNDHKQHDAQLPFLMRRFVIIIIVSAASVFQVVTQPVIATGPVVVQRPQNWMIPSILACLCCFCPTGIFAVYYANQVHVLINCQIYEGRSENFATDALSSKLDVRYILSFLLI